MPPLFFSDIGRFGEFGEKLQTGQLAPCGLDNSRTGWFADSLQYNAQGAIFHEYSRKQMTDVHYFPW